MSGPFTESHKKKFEQNGFFILEGVLDPSAVAVIRKAVVDLAEREKSCGIAHYYEFDTTGKTQRVWNLLNKSSIFRELIETPILLECMEWIFKRDTIHQKYFLSSLQANLLNPGAAAQKLHIDTPVPEPLPPWVIKANSIWLLDDFTEINGSTEVIPGSHKWPHKPKPSDHYRTDTEVVIAPAGSVLFTHGSIWHRGGANRSECTRIALLCSFAASFAREIASEEDYFKVLDPQILENASPTLRLILGADHGVKAGERNLLTSPLNQTDGTP